MYSQFSREIFVELKHYFLQYYYVYGFSVFLVWLGGFGDENAIGPYSYRDVSTSNYIIYAHFRLKDRSCHYHVIKAMQQLAVGDVRVEVMRAGEAIWSEKNVKEVEDIQAEVERELDNAAKRARARLTAARPAQLPALMGLEAPENPLVRQLAEW
jgi:hypothetical protein